MSTFNGEAYLESQIDTIFAQRGVEVHLVVRDDGSSDSTVDILRRKQKQYINLTLYEAKINIGAAKSFLYLLTHATAEFDFYAFADQDDVWKEDKLSRAVCSLAKFNTPTLYCSSCDIVDKSLNVLSVRDIHPEIPISLGSTLIDRCPSACTMVFNLPLFQVLSGLRPEFVRMHDHWTMLVTQSLGGVVILDGVPTMLYRQHDNNVVGFTSKTVWRRLVPLLRKAIHSPRERSRQAASLYKELNHKISSVSDLELIRQVAEYPIRVVDWLRLLVNPKLRTLSPGVTLLAHIAVLFRYF
jgi:rhamnosyltransferase